MNSPRTRTTILLAMALTLQTGCQSESERVAALSQEHTRLQAEQSLRMAQLQEQVATGSRALVEADANARGEIIGLQRDIQSERAEIDQQRDRLEAERKQIADERRSTPVISAAITSIGLLLACLLPLLVCLKLLSSPDDPVDDQAVWQVLLDEGGSHTNLLTHSNAERTERIGDDPRRPLEQRNVTESIPTHEESECPTS
ncbi:MAG: hypothetical protein HQ518_01495 [Rhodopirellula sp.]|nr:hypothetical protein [Rhodopirellula sp.]